jgi:hypothetical protein
MAGCNGGNLGIYTFLWPAATLRPAIQHTAICTYRGGSHKHNIDESPETFDSLLFTVRDFFQILDFLELKVSAIDFFPAAERGAWG